jgi:hypothetical protein
VRIVQDHAADELHVEVAHAEGSLCSLAVDRKGFDQQVVERRALFEPLAEFDGLAREIFVAEQCDRRFEFIDTHRPLSQACDFAVVSVDPRFDRGEYRQS